MLIEALRTVSVPLEAPILTEVAAPNKLPVNAFVLNTLAVPVLDVTMLGLVPFKFSAVALVPVIVALPIVNVPLEAPIAMVVAAPNKLPVRALVLNTAAVPVLDVIMAGLAPFKFSAVALAAVIVAFRKFNVPLVAPIVTVVAAPNAFTVVAVASTSENVV